MILRAREISGKKIHDFVVSSNSQVLPPLAIFVLWDFLVDVTTEKHT